MWVPSLYLTSPHWFVNILFRGHGIGQALYREHVLVLSEPRLNDHSIGIIGDMLIMLALLLSPLGHRTWFCFECEMLSKTTKASSLGWLKLFISEFVSGTGSRSQSGWWGLGGWRPHQVDFGGLCPWWSDGAEDRLPPRFARGSLSSSWLHPEPRPQAAEDSARRQTFSHGPSSRCLEHPWHAGILFRLTPSQLPRGGVQALLVYWSSQFVAIDTYPDIQKMVFQMS